VYLKQADKRLSHPRSGVLTPPNLLEWNQID